MSTLRLPPPPIKPKPLHLTMSMRSKEKSHRPNLPDFNQEYNEGGTIKVSRSYSIEGDDNEDEDHFGTAKTSPTSELPSLSDLFSGEKGIELDEPDYCRRDTNSRKDRVNLSGSSRTGSTRKRRGGSTLKRRKVGDRTSIFFDSSLENPLLPPLETAPSSPLQLSISDSKAETSNLDEPLDLLLETLVQDRSRVNELEEDEDGIEKDTDHIIDLEAAIPALSLHPFSGETAFGELNFERGVDLMIEVEDLGGGWSLGYSKVMGEESRGLIPRGWYAFINSPALSTSTLNTQLTHLDELTALAPIPFTSVDDSNLPPSPSPFPSPPPSPVISSSDRPCTPPLQNSYDKVLPSTLNDSPLSITSSNIGGRSIGRNVVISGIEFEPTDTSVWNNPPIEDHGLYSVNDIWGERLMEGGSHEESRRGLSMFSDEELGGRLGGWEREESITESLVSPSVKSNNNDGVEQVESHENLLLFDDHVQQEILPTGENLSDPSEEEEEVTNNPGEEIDEYFESNHGEVNVVEEAVALPETLDVSDSSGELFSPVVEVHADTNLADPDVQHKEVAESDTLEAREERWAAIIAQADNPYFPPILDDSPSDLPQEEDFAAEEEDSFPSYADEYVSPPLSPMIPSSTARTLSANSPPARDSIFSRFGLGTVGRTYSTSTIGLNKSTHSSGTILKTKIPKGLAFDWIANGDIVQEEEEEADDSTPEFHIEAGPSWQTDSQPFCVQVHSPETRRSPGTRSEYTSFQITTYLSNPEFSEVRQIGATVERRYSHFSLLHALLLERYPILVFPDLPPKTLSGRFNEDFIDIRRRDLERWLNRIGRHDILRSSEEVRGFLAIEEDGELRRLLSDPDEPSTFFKKVYYPEFNFDHSEAGELVDRFEIHNKALEIGGGIVEVESEIGKLRERLRDTSISMTQLAHSMVRMIAGISLPLSRIAELEEDVEESARHRAQKLCLQTEEGAFTWKESCDEALSLTKAFQATAESISAVGTFHDTNARHSLLPIQELLRESSSPYSQHTELISNHKSALLHHSQLSEMEFPDDLDSAKRHEEEMSRCDTIINITSAELERIHKEKMEDLKWIAEEYLRTQIDFHERSLEQLRFAQSHFDPSAYSSLSKTGARLKSLLERPNPPPSPILTQPSNFGLPMSITTRPVVEVLNGTVQNLIQIGATTSNLRRSNSKGPPASGGKSVEEILKGQEMEMGVKRVEDGKETWRQSIFGKGSFW